MNHQAITAETMAAAERPVRQDGEAWPDPFRAARLIAAVEFDLGGRRPAAG